MSLEIDRVYLCPVNQVVLPRDLRIWRVYLVALESRDCNLDYWLNRKPYGLCGTGCRIIPNQYKIPGVFFPLLAFYFIFASVCDSVIWSSDCVFTLSCQINLKLISFKEILKTLFTPPLVLFIALRSSSASLQHRLYIINTFKIIFIIT